MAEALKDKFGLAAAEGIAKRLHASWPKFDRRAFLQALRPGFEEAGIMDRGRLIAAALGNSLPRDYPTAIAIILKSLGPELTRTHDFGMEPFAVLPFTFFVAERGLDHFDLSMQAQYELTKRATAEFSIRAFLLRHQERTLDVLRDWTRDENPHVRRLTSEGTRPRLPWAARLPSFQRDPAPVIALLERLKDDPEIYVRRSVANNLNDIGKDNPAIAAEIARRWRHGADANRLWLIRHAMRSAVKRGEAQALQVLGFAGAQDLAIENARVTPGKALLGGEVRVSFDIVNRREGETRANADIAIHFVKANGGRSPKVFKGKSGVLQSRESIRVEKAISLAQMTTRRHYPGRHLVSVVINGQERPIGWFDLAKR